MFVVLDRENYAEQTFLKVLIGPHFGPLGFSRLMSEFDSMFEFRILRREFLGSLLVLSYMLLEPSL